MKQLFITLAALALIATSCNKNDITDTLGPKDGNLAFSLSMGNVQNTKAAELTGSLLEGKANTAGKGIALYAYHNQAAGAWGKWYTDELLYSSGWGITSSRFAIASDSKYVSYWPINATMLAQVGATFTDATFTTGSYPQFTYTIDHAAGSGDDLIAGLTNVASNIKVVPISMYHLLSQINFAVKGGAGKEIAITSIALANISSEATYTFDGNGSTITTPGSWSTPITPYAYTYSPVGGVIPAVTATSDIYVLGDGGKWAVGATALYWNSGKSGGAGWDVPANIAAANILDNSLMLLPQSFTAGGGAEVTINFTIDGTAQDPQVVDLGDRTLAAWLPNKRYVYLLDLKPGEEEFLITVLMTPWDETNIDQPDITPQTLMPTNTDVNTIAASGNINILPSGTAKLFANEVWDMSAYNFALLAIGESMTFTFPAALTFNGHSITPSLPAGFSASPTSISATGSVTITNVSAATYSVAATLERTVEGTTADANYTFTGDGSAIDVSTYTMTGLQTSNVTIKIRFPDTTPSATIITSMEDVLKYWAWDANVRSAVFYGSRYDITSPTTLQTYVQFATALTETQIFYFTGNANGKLIDLTSYTMISDVGVTVVFVGTRPTNTNIAKMLVKPATEAGKWTWDAANEIATYTP